MQHPKYLLTNLFTDQYTLNVVQLVPILTFSDVQQIDNPFAIFQIVATDSPLNIWVWNYPVRQMQRANANLHT